MKFIILSITHNDYTKKPEQEEIGLIKRSIKNKALNNLGLQTTVSRSHVPCGSARKTHKRLRNVDDMNFRNKISQHLEQFSQAFRLCYSV